MKSPSSLNNKEFELAQKIMKELGSSRKEELPAAYEVDSEAVEKFIERTYEKEGVPLNRFLLSQLLKKEKEIETKQSPAPPTEFERLLLNQETEIQEFAYALRNKKFFTNQQLLDLYPLRKKPRAYKKYGMLVTAVGLSCLTRNPWVIFSVLGVGLFLTQFFNESEEAEWEKSMRLREMVISRQMENRELIFDYQYQTLPFEWRLLSDEMICEMRLNIATDFMKRKLFSMNKPIPFLPFALHLWAEEKGLKYNLKEELPLLILRQWQQENQPIRLIDMYYLTELERKLKELKESQQYFNN